MPKPMGGPGGQVPEKSKDFAGSMKRLLNNLNSWNFLIYISLLLAMISAILSLISPNKLSGLTDTITEGISPNMEVLEEISTEIMKNFEKEQLTKKVSKIMKDSSISTNDKKIFTDAIEQIAKLNNPKESQKLILSLPDSIMKILLEDIKINGTIIDTNDQIAMLNLTKGMENTNRTEQNLEALHQFPKFLGNCSSV